MKTFVELSKQLDGLRSDLIEKISSFLNDGDIIEINEEDKDYVTDTNENKIAIYSLMGCEDDVWIQGIIENHKEGTAVDVDIILTDIMDVHDLFLILHLVK